MKSLIDYSLNEEYEKVKRLGDRLAEVDSLIDWGAFRMRRIRLIRGIASPLYPCVLPQVGLRFSSEFSSRRLEVQLERSGMLDI